MNLYYILKLNHTVCCPRYLYFGTLIRYNTYKGVDYYMKYSKQEVSIYLLEKAWIHR